MMRPSIIHPNYPPFIQWILDVITPIIPIFQKCAYMNTNIPFSLSRCVCNVVNRDNSPGGYWSKGGQQGDNARHIPRCL